MKRSEFTLHEVTFESEHFRAVRYRNSNGTAGIKITGVNVKDGPHVSASFETHLHGNQYEEVVREFIALLDKAADDPCVLPKGAK